MAQVKASIARGIGKFTPQELINERDARAAREEIFRRIFNEAEASSCTFEQAVHRLGMSHHIIGYFPSGSGECRIDLEKDRQFL